MHRVAAQIAIAEPRIDILINNAGAMFSSRHVTEEGLEYTFALNHLSYFVLTQGLRKSLFASEAARIVNTASDAHKAATLDFKDLQSIEAYARLEILEWLRFGGPGYQVYGRSKLCNILFTRELARRLEQLASGLRRYSLWRSCWRFDCVQSRHRQTFRTDAATRRGNASIPCFFKCGCWRHRPVFSQMPRHPHSWITPD